MTRPPRCDFCCAAEGIARIRPKRLRRWVWACARHRDRTETLTARQRGIVARRMVEMAGGG